MKDKESKAGEEKLMELGMFNFQKKRTDLIALWNCLNGNCLTLVKC